MARPFLVVSVDIQKRLFIKICTIERENQKILGLVWGKRRREKGIIWSKEKLQLCSLA